MSHFLMSCVFSGLNGKVHLLAELSVKKVSQGSQGLSRERKVLLSFAILAACLRAAGKAYGDARPAKAGSWQLVPPKAGFIAVQNGHHTLVEWDIKRCY